MDKRYRVDECWYKTTYDMFSNRQQVLGHEIKTIATGLSYEKAVEIVDGHAPSEWLLGIAVVNENPTIFDNRVAYQRTWTENLKWL